MNAPSKLVIASRESRLALWQSEHVCAQLRRIYPGCQVDILPMTTRGDQILDRSLAKVGGKGLFVKELEAALADGRADVAVHSAKDVPMELPEGFELAAIGEREDARDAFVSNQQAALGQLPAGAVVGTSSLRREAQLRARYPGVQVASLRGNVQTRVAKLDRGEYQAIILAAAGLKRLGLAGRIRSYLEPEDSLPAPGQGALAIECRAGRPELMQWLAALHHADSAACVRAERALSRALSGSCQLPLAAYAVVETAVEDPPSGRGLWLRALVASPDGRTVIRDELRAPLAGGDAPERLGAELAARLKKAGADAIIAALT